MGYYADLEVEKSERNGGGYYDAWSDYNPTPNDSLRYRVWLLMKECRKNVTYGSVIKTAKRFALRDDYFKDKGVKDIENLKQKSFYKRILHEKEEFKTWYKQQRKRK